MNYAKLKATVTATNLVNKSANELYEKMSLIFEPLVGCKILKSNGELLKEISNKVREVKLSDSNVSYYTLNSKYSLCFVVKSCVNHGETAVYSEISVYIGSYENSQVLEKMYDKPNFKCDYDINQLVGKITEIKSKRKELEDLESKIGPFTEFAK